MTDYNFWADLLDTFQSSPSWIKALWLSVPPGFLLAVIAMLLPPRKRAGMPDGELVYSVYRGGQDELQIVSHVAQPDHRPALLLPLHPRPGTVPEAADPV
jgi:hypothetical protein